MLRFIKDFRTPNNLFVEEEKLFRLFRKWIPNNMFCFERDYKSNYISVGFDNVTDGETAYLYKNEKLHSFKIKSRVFFYFHPDGATKDTRPLFQVENYSSIVSKIHEYLKPEETISKMSVSNFEVWRDHSGANETSINFIFPETNIFIGICSVFNERFAVLKVFVTEIDGEIKCCDDIVLSGEITTTDRMYEEALANFYSFDFINSFVGIRSYHVDALRDIRRGEDWVGKIVSMLSEKTGEHNTIYLNRRQDVYPCETVMYFTPKGVLAMTRELTGDRFSAKHSLIFYEMSTFSDVEVVDKTV